MIQIYTKEAIEKQIEYHGERNRERFEKGFVTMTVKEVIEKLSTFPEEMPVVLVSESRHIPLSEGYFEVGTYDDYVCDVLEIGGF